jgi:uncharacterized membrane protein
VSILLSFIVFFVVAFLGIRWIHRLRDRKLKNITDDNLRVALGMLSFIVVSAVAITASIFTQFFFNYITLAP